MPLNLNRTTQSQPAAAPAPASKARPVFGRTNSANQAQRPVAKTDKKEYPKVNENQIIRIDGRNCFLEVTKGGFNLKKSNDIGKVHLSVNAYDAETKKMVTSILLYVDFDHWMELSDLFDTGEYLNLMQHSRERQIQGKYSYPSEFWIDNGRMIEDGNVYARMMKLSVGSKKDKNDHYLPIEEQPIIVRGEITPGELSETGLVMPKRGAKPIKYTQVPVPQSQFKAMLKLVNMQIQAYYTASATKMVIKEALGKIYEEACKNNKLLLELKQFVDVED